MQARKLGLKSGQRVSLDDPPPGWTLSDPPDGLEYVGGPGEVPGGGPGEAPVRPT